MYFFLLPVYRILGSKTKNTVYSSFLSLTVEKTISYYYLLSLLVPIISYYSFFGGGGSQVRTGGSAGCAAPRSWELLPHQLVTLTGRGAAGEP